MKIEQIGVSGDSPVFGIGTIRRPLQDDEARALNTTSISFHVGVCKSRINSLEKVDGYHFALSVYPPLSWDEGRKRRIVGENLSLLWREVESEALEALLPELSPEERAELRCATSSNAEGTAQRQDVHAHVQVATKSEWSSGRIRRMVDDARAPKLLMAEGAEMLQKSLDGSPPRD